MLSATIRETEGEFIVYLSKVELWQSDRVSFSTANADLTRGCEEGFVWGWTAYRDGNGLMSVLET